MKDVSPKTYELIAGPEKLSQSPVHWFTFIRNGRDRREDSIQFSIRKVQPVNSFKLNKR